MNIKLDENEIEKALHEIKVQPTREWQEETFAELQRTALMDELVGESSAASGDFLSLSLTKNIMKKFTMAVVAVALVAGAGFFTYSNQPTVAAAKHTANAETALAQLQNYTLTGELVSQYQFSLIAIAYANEDGATEEEISAVEEIIEEVVAETEAAIEETEEIGNPRKASGVLAQIDHLQDHTIDVLVNIAGVIDDEDLQDAIAAAVKTTADENEAVEEAQEEAEEAAENDEEEISIEIDTSEDEEDKEDADEEDEEDESNKETKDQERLERAEELLEDFDTENLTAAMQEKFDTVQAIIVACGDDEEDIDTEEEDETKCNTGKAKGLATALAAKARNEERKQEKNNEGEEDEDQDEDEDDDEDDENEEDDEDEEKEKKEKGENSGKGKKKD